MGEGAESVAQAFVRAINRQDIELLAELMTDGHCFIDSLGNRFEGRATMFVGWQEYFRMVSRLQADRGRDAQRRPGCCDATCCAGNVPECE
jgi:ketosteroid isomerase-like protein